MLLLLTLTAVAVGLICGRLYSFVAVLLTGPLLALIGFEAAAAQGWTTRTALLVALGTVALSQTAFLAGVRLRFERRRLRGQASMNADVAPRRSMPAPREDTGA